MYKTKNSARLNPFFSIVITVLNGNQHVVNCLEKMRAQSFENFELVIIDGGSKDGTVSSIKNIALNNVNLDVMPGIGLYEGLNAGVEASKGEWLYFMGIDDEFYDNNVLRNVNRHILDSTSKYEVLVGHVYYPRQDFIFKPTLGSPYMVRHKVHHQGMFYKRDIFNEIRYNEKYKISSDYELNLRLSLKGVKHKYFNLLMARIGEDGISNTQVENSSRELHKIHASVFKGIAKVWVTNYFKALRSILLFRQKHGLTNLKKRIKNFF